MAFRTHLPAIRIEARDWNGWFYNFDGHDRRPADSVGSWEVRDSVDGTTCSSDVER